VGHPDPQGDAPDFALPNQFARFHALTFSSSKTLYWVVGRVHPGRPRAQRNPVTRL
jgi:hypothetical protein